MGSKDLRPSCQTIFLVFDGTHRYLSKTIVFIRKATTLPPIENQYSYLFERHEPEKMFLNLIIRKVEVMGKTMKNVLSYFVFISCCGGGMSFYMVFVCGVMLHSIVFEDEVNMFLSSKSQN